MESIRYRAIMERVREANMQPLQLSVSCLRLGVKKSMLQHLFSSLPPHPPTPLLSVRGRHPETHTELKVTHLQHYHCTPLHQCSRIALGCGFCVSMNLIILIGALILSLSSPDLPASSLQYQCGSVDYLCSPRLVKKGPTPRPCHDRPAIKPRPQPSASPRPPTAQKPQGKIP